MAFCCAWATCVRHLRKANIAQGLQNLYDRIERMRDLGPEFIDITWFVRRQDI